MDGRTNGLTHGSDGRKVEPLALHDSANMDLHGPVRTSIHLYVFLWIYVGSYWFMWVYDDLT